MDEGRRGRAWLWVPLLAFAGSLGAGCETTSLPSRTSSGGSAGSAGSGTVDFGDMECVCSDGRVGTCECGSEACTFCTAVGACNCDSCPAFEPVPNPPFDACGGDPVGSWSTTEFSSSSLVVLRYRDLEPTRECLVELAEVSAFEMRMDLGAAGAALNFHMTTLPFVGRMLETCYTRGSIDFGCDAIELSSGRPCQEEGCGICRCDYPFYGDTGSGTWTVTGTMLSVDVAENVRQFDFCQRGDTLELRQMFTDLRYSLQRVAP